VIAVDTNILVHAHRRDASLHGRARPLLQELAEAPTPWAICYHSLVEFHAVATRRGLWPKPSTPAEAWNQISAWRESPSLRILYDSEACLGLLQAAALGQQVTGGMIHDARIAVCCQVNGIAELWTVDRDFSRFPQLRCRNPLSRGG
jgi:toxin-antitoxin system PIN domain toxin